MGERCKKEFLKSSDIAIILGIGRTRAMDIVHMFVQSGRGIHFDDIYRVRSTIFYTWQSQFREILPTRQFKVRRGSIRPFEDQVDTVKREYLGAADIQAILDIGRTKSLALARDFIAKGEGIQFGRIYRVESRAFYEWLASMDSYRPERKLRAV